MSKVSLKIIFDAVKPNRFKEISMVNCGIEKYAAKELMTHLKSAEALEVLDLSHNKIENGIKAIFDSLKGRENLRVFDISYNLLTHVQDIKASFSAFISDTPNLQLLNFTYTNIHQNLDEESLKTIGTLSHLAGISFESSTCKMDQIKLKAVAQALVDAKNREAPVDFVILRGCFNTYPDYAEFFDVLSQLSPLKEAEQLDGFELIDDPIGNDSKAVFKYMDISLGTFESDFHESQYKRGESPVMKYFLTLVQSLNMDSCKMTEKDARLIKYSLKLADKKSTLKSLTLSHNPLGAKGAAAVANIEVTELDLSNCKIGVGGACAFGKALKTNTSLKKLNLYNNGLKVEGARFLAQGLEETKTLEYLDVGSNTIRNKGFDALKSCLESSVSFLAAKNNQIKDVAFNQFMEAYHASGNSTLKTLMLASNDISMYTIKMAEEDIEGRMYIDLKLKLENNNERVLFLCGIHPENTKPLLKKYFDKRSCGIIENIDIIRGREKKKGKQNIFGFVKFAHKNGKMRVIGNLKEFEENAIKL
jgi:Ran GTPase-activating protein (RanGAP) involved in mRNA processing and transport